MDLKRGVPTCRFVPLQDMRPPQSVVAAGPARPRRKSTPCSIFPHPHNPPPARPYMARWQAVPSSQLHSFFFSILFSFFTSARHVHVLHHIGAARPPQHRHGRLPFALHGSILFNTQRHQPKRHSRTQCMRRDHRPGITHPPTDSMYQRRCRGVDVQRYRVRESRGNHGLVPWRWGK
jgi:hypothetical protein